MKQTIKISAIDEEMVLKSALISGRHQGYDGAPTSMYFGSLDFDEIFEALYFSNRAVLKILTESLDVPLEECDNFLISAVSEALTKEFNESKTGISDIQASRKYTYGDKNQN